MSTLMTADQARAFRADRDQAVRLLARQSKPRLISEANRVGIYASASWSKDELIAAISGRSYPISRLNEAIHVLHHTAELRNDTCQWCAAQAAMFAALTPDEAGELAARLAEGSIAAIDEAGRLDKISGFARSLYGADAQDYRAFAAELKDLLADLVVTA